MSLLHSALPTNHPQVHDLLLWVCVLLKDLQTDLIWRKHFVQLAPARDADVLPTKNGQGCGIQLRPLALVEVPLGCTCISNHYGLPKQV